MASAERRPYLVTPGRRGRLLGVRDDAMASDDDRHKHEEDPLESTELARRLRRMEWPPAPPEVKARVLERIVERADEELGRGENESPAESRKGLG